MTPTDDTKTCGLCGEDCSDRPRTRDSGGRYFCRTCYDEATARQKSGQSGTTLLGDTHDVDATVLAAILEDAAAHAPAPPAPDEVCKRCGKMLEGGSPVCPRCGHRAKSHGRRAKGTDASESGSPAAAQPDFTVPLRSSAPTWHIPTWVMIGVPLIFIIAIVFAAMPRSRRVTRPPPAVAPHAEQAPDLENARAFANESIAFEYPGNWRLATDYPGFHREKYIVVDGGADAQIIIRVFQSSGAPEEELRSRLDELRNFGSGYTDREKLTKYGALEGTGREVTAYLGSRPVRHRVFLSKLSIHTMLEVQEICPDARLRHADAGFAHFAKTLRPK